MLKFGIYSTKKETLTGRTKSNAHAARDGTAAGRHHGAPREYFMFSKKKKMYLD